MDNQPSRATIKAAIIAGILGLVGVTLAALIGLALPFVQALAPRSEATPIVIIIPPYVTSEAPGNSAPLGVQPLSFVYPVDGEILDYGETYLFKVIQVSNADGYLWGFFQNGNLVWENYRDEGEILSTNEYVIPADSTAHNRFLPGDVEIWVRAYVNKSWTEPSIITIQLSQP